uniref:DUF4592 domain-containing protein n=1 Tax=Denticeps clupeoides TaxID=299321 RepID=A0AAY4CZL1_9TELE
MATGPPDAVVDQEPVEENPGKKKSKFQAFKSFFVKKKRKESGSGAGDTSLKSSQSSDHVSGPDTTLVHADKDSQSGSKINLALKALSHDSVFVSDSPSSQDIVHDKVKSLQLQLKQSITHGSRLPRTDDDTGTLSEDDGLPCSPMEFPVLGGSRACPLNSRVSLEGQEFVPVQMCEAVYPEIPVDFSQPASASACLDSSMARHRINIKNKACTKRRPATVRARLNIADYAEDLIQIPDQDSRPEFPAQPQIAEGQATSLSSYSSDGEEYVQQAKILPSRLSDSCEASTLLTIPAGNVLLEQSSKTCLEETGSLLQEVLSSLTSGLVLRPEGVLLEMEVCWYWILQVGTELKDQFIIEVVLIEMLLTEPEEDIIQSKTENRATDRQDFASLACAESTTVVLHSDSIPTIQEPEEQETGQIRFTIASAWQRTANGGSTKEPSSSENVSVSPPKHTVEKAETLTPVRPECLFSPVRTLSTPILLPPTGRSSASEEPNPENLFGIRLRKTPVRFRQGSDTDVRPDDLQHGPASESDITRSGLVKPDRNLGQAPHPSPESAGWISLARRKQKVFKENSLEEPLLGKSLTEVGLYRLPRHLHISPPREEQHVEVCHVSSTVTCSVAVVQPQDEPPWLALAKKKAKAWSEMAQIVQ